MFESLEKTLQAFGEHRIDIVEAEREVQKLTGRSLPEVFDYIATTLGKAIARKQ
jgi:hypothetical protein